MAEIDPRDAEIAAQAMRIAKLRNGLEKAAEWFRQYMEDNQEKKIGSKAELNFHRMVYLLGVLARDKPRADP